MAEEFDLVKVRKFGDSQKKNYKDNREDFKIVKRSAINRRDQKEMNDLIKMATNLGFVVDIQCGMWIEDEACRGKLKINKENDQLRCVKCKAKWILR